MSTQRRQAVNEIAPGRYELRNFEYDGRPGQTIQFMEKAINPSNGNYEIAIDGTSVDDLLKIAVARLAELDSRFPSKHNAKAINRISRALEHLADRREKREENGTYGQPVK